MIDNNNLNNIKEKISLTEEINIDKNKAHLEEINLLKNELKSKEDNFLRLMADFENYRKRMIRDKNENNTLITLKFIEDLIPILDNLKLGIDAFKKQENYNNNIINGFQLVLDSMNEVFKKNNIEVLNPDNQEAFNPSFHECIANINNEDIQQGSIIEVVRIGYKIGKKLIRPASVVVSNGNLKEDKI